MTQSFDAYEQFNTLFWASAKSVHGATAPPYADLWRSAELGFTEDFGRKTLETHSWLVFLNRIWDAHRTMGLPDGPIRVPDRIWKLAAQDDDEGRLHRELLEATGMRMPEDFGQELAFHLTLWGQEALAGALRGSVDVTESLEIVHAEGPVSVDIVSLPQGFHVELRPDFAGTFAIRLHWEDGTTEDHQTPWLDSGESYSFDTVSERKELPQSVHITRKGTR